MILRNLKNGSKNAKKNNYLLNTANIPDLKKPSEAADDDDRDEQVLNSQCFKVYKDDRLQRYIVACEVKIKCDIHIALIHLAANGYSVKNALETIENLGSFPIEFVNGKNGPGIWSSDEIAIFVERMKYKRLYKRWNDIKKYLPNKSIPNLINSFYTLKGIGYSFSRQKCTPSSKRLELQTKYIGYDVVDSQNCENCSKKILKKQLVKESESRKKLCALCKLYYELYGKQRPNAVVYPLL